MLSLSKGRSRIRSNFRAKSATLSLIGRYALPQGTTRHHGFLEIIDCVFEYEFLLNPICVHSCPFGKRTIFLFSLSRRIRRRLLEATRPLSRGTPFWMMPNVELSPLPFFANFFTLLPSTVRNAIVSPSNRRGRSLKLLLLVPW